MSQSDVIDILIKEPDKWFTVDELNEHINISRHSVNHSVVQLIKFGEVDEKFETVKVNKKGRGFHHTIRYVKINPKFYKDYMEENGCII